MLVECVQQGCKQWELCSYRFLNFVVYVVKNSGSLCLILLLENHGGAVVSGMGKAQYCLR